MKITDVADALFKWRKRSVSSLPRLENQNYIPDTSISTKSLLGTSKKLTPDLERSFLPNVSGRTFSLQPFSSFRSASGRQERVKEGGRRVVTSTTMRGLVDLWDPSPHPIRVQVPSASIVLLSTPDSSTDSKTYQGASGSSSESSFSTDSDIPLTPVCTKVPIRPVSSSSVRAPARSCSSPLIRVYPPPSPDEIKPGAPHAYTESPTSIARECPLQTSPPHCATLPSIGTPESPSNNRYTLAKVNGSGTIRTKIKQYDDNPFEESFMNFTIVRMIPVRIDHIIYITNHRTVMPRNRLAPMKLANARWSLLLEVLA